MKWYQIKKFFSGFFLVCSLFGCKKCISGSENMKMPCNLSSVLCKSTGRLYTLQLIVNYHGQIKVCANLMAHSFAAYHKNDYIRSRIGYDKGVP